MTHTLRPSRQVSNRAPRLKKSRTGAGPQTRLPAGLPLFLQKRPASGVTWVQREENEEQQGFNYSFLPPSLGFNLGNFSGSADTGTAQLGYRHGSSRFALGYDYGGDIFGSARFGAFNTRMAYNPHDRVGRLGIGGSWNGLRMQAGVNTTGAVTAGLSYGAPILPMPFMLRDQAGAAWQGMRGVGSALPAFLDNPIEAYDAQRENIGAMGTFGRSLDQIYSAGQQGDGGLPFGFSAGYTFDPVARHIFHASLQGRF